MTGAKFRALDHAAANYSVVLAENRKLHNEVQELKGVVILRNFSFKRMEDFSPFTVAYESFSN